MLQEKFWEIVIGVIALLVVFMWLLPMLSGIVHTIALIVVVIIAIWWVLRLGNIQIP